MNTRALSDWLQEITALHPKQIDMGLSRMQTVLARSGWKGLSGTVVTVTGTNGKGSCVAFLEAFFLRANYRVAAYTSPHVHAFNERLRIQGEVLDDAHWCYAFEQVARYRQDVPLTFFECTTLAALFIIQSMPLDIIVLEVGLGGRLDAVNVVDPDIAVITSIDLDHMDYLGTTRQAIAQEKLGIARKNRPLVCGEPHPPEGFQESVAATGAIYYPVHGDCVPKPAFLHPTSAACALKVVALLPQYPIAHDLLVAALEETRLPGRFERVLGHHNLWMDVAHNPHAARYLAQNLAKVPGVTRWHAVVGMLKDKDIPNTLSPLLGVVDLWHLASLSQINRGASAGHLLAQIRTVPQLGNALFLCYDGVGLAFENAKLMCAPQEGIIVFGSFHTVAAASSVPEYVP